MTRDWTPPPPPRLPLLFLHLFIDGEYREVVAGDLTELWHIWRTRHGPLYSRYLLWRHALASVAAPPLLSSDPGGPPRHRRKGDPFMSQLGADLWYGLRGLVRRPGFSLLLVATLALGIGLLSTAWGVLHAALIAPLPYGGDANRVAFVLGWNTKQDRMNFNVPLADAEDLRRETARSSDTPFEAVAAYRNWNANLSGGDRPDRVQAYRVTPGLFPLLQVEAALGRALDPEVAAETPRAVVLSWSLFQRHFGGDAGLLGSSVELDGEPYTVVGVMPSQFDFPIFNFRGELWALWRPDPATWAGDRRRASSVVAVARLRPGVELEQAQVWTDAFAERLAIDHPETNRDRGMRVQPMQKLIVDLFGQAFFVPFAALVGMLLLICITLASLLMVRSMEREQEVAIRTSLGATGGRLLRLLLTESLVLGLAGGAAGAGLAALLLRALPLALPDLIVRTVPAVARARLDPSLLLFVLAVTLIAAVTFGLLPAFAALRVDLNRSLHGGRTRRRSATLRKLLVGGQAALAVVLLVGTALLVETFHNLTAVNPGFEPDDTLVASVALPASRFPEPEDRRRYLRDAAEAVERLPGVTSSAWVNHLPFSTANDTTRFAVSGSESSDTAVQPRSRYRTVSPGYFETLGIPLLAGRTFDQRAWDAEACEILVNRSLAATHLSDRPLGARLRFGDGSDECEVIGMVGNVLHWELDEKPGPEIYFPLAAITPTNLSIAARSSLPPERLLETFRRTLLDVDPEQAVFGVTTLDRMVADSLFARRAAMNAMAAVAAMVLFLSLIGLYGVVAYTVSRRQPELGLRIALGAGRSEIVRQVAAEGLRPVVVGMVVGLLATLPAVRALRGLVYGVGIYDPPTFGIAIVLLLAASILACALPAWRASRIDPVGAIRSE